MMKNRLDQVVGFLLGLVFVAICYFLIHGIPGRLDPISTYSSGMPEMGYAYTPSMDDLRLCQLQISAVKIDMHKYLGWFPDDKEGLRQASLKAVDDLTAIRAYLGQCKFHDREKTLADANRSMIDQLIRIYDGIEEKELDMIETQFREYVTQVEEYQKEYERADGRNDSDDQISVPAEILHEQEFGSVGDPEDRKTYIRIIEQIGEGQYNAACKALLQLRPKYKGEMFEQCLLLKMSDCFLMSEPGTEEYSIFDPEKAIEILEEILDSKTYSPVLYEAFRRWRVQTQSFWHGMSNMSGIPNWDYNLKRWQAVKTIEKYLQDDPTDEWAKKQADLLLDLPNLYRGGAFGNDALVEQHAMYSTERTE